MKRTPLKRKSILKAKTGFKNKTPIKAKKTEPKPKKRSQTKNKPVKCKVIPKAKRVKTLKKKLWTIFSIYIRKSNADHTGWLMTCDGEWKTWKETHCGHLWHNSERNQQLGGNELWYYENNFAPQTGDGNTFNKDDSAKKYMAWAIKKYGTKEVEKMYKMKQTYKLWTEEELQAKYEYYKAKVDSL